MSESQASLLDLPVGVTYGAELSVDGLYRYRLWRRWGDGERMAWIMLNPSTADAVKNDQTIRRCMFYARREGYDGIEVINLYALRATRPAHLLDHPDPEGPGNSAAWDTVLSDHGIGMIVAAWGASRPKGCPASRAAAQWFTGGWYCLGRTENGHPRHPSRLGNNQPFVPLAGP